MLLAGPQSWLQGHHSWLLDSAAEPVCTCTDKPSLTGGACMQLLYDTFSAFGMIVATPKIMRDPDNGSSRGFGFVSYNNFESSDAAIEAMNGQFLCNR